MEGVADEGCEEEEKAGSHSHATVLSRVADEGGEEEEGADSCEGEAGKVERGVVEDVVVVPKRRLVDKKEANIEREKDRCVSKDCLASNFPHCLQVVEGTQRILSNEPAGNPESDRAVCPD